MPSSSIQLGRVLVSALVLALSLLHVQNASALDLGNVWATTGSGPIVKEARSVSTFHALKLSTSARVVVRQGEHYSVEVQAEENVAPLIDTTVEDGTLVVEDNTRYKSPSAEVVITAPRIGSIATSGAVAVLVEGLSNTSLVLSMGGSSAVTLKSLSSKKLYAALGGSSALKASGVVGEFSSVLGGSSAIEASALEANSVTVAGGGSAQAVVWAKESLRIALGGSSGVRYYGNVTPALATAGSSTVKSLGEMPLKRQ